jgi:hypothetical protein
MSESVNSRTLNPFHATFVGIISGLDLRVCHIAQVQFHSPHLDRDGLTPLLQLFQVLVSLMAAL